MATTGQIAKSRRPPKFATRIQRRCQICGRPRAVYRKFKVCRICLRNLVAEGKVPGMKKASW